MCLSRWDDCTGKHAWKVYFLFFNPPASCPVFPLDCVWCTICWSPSSCSSMTSPPHTQCNLARQVLKQSDILTQPPPLLTTVARLAKSPTAQNISGCRTQEHPLPTLSGDICTTLCAAIPISTTTPSLDFESAVLCLRHTWHPTSLF